MKDILRKSMFMGLGLAAMTKDKVQSVARQMAEYSKMSEEEGKKLADFLVKESRKARKELKETIDKMVGEAADKMPGKRRIAELEARVAALEAQLAAQAAAKPKPRKAKGGGKSAGKAPAE